MNRDDIPSTEDFALRLSSQLEQNLNRSAGADAFFFILVIRFYIVQQQIKQNHFRKRSLLDFSSLVMSSQILLNMNLNHCKTEKKNTNIWLLIGSPFLKKSDHIKLIIIVLIGLVSSILEHNIFSLSPLFLMAVFHSQRFYFLHLILIFQNVCRS